MERVTILDGPVGTELARRGVDISGPAWSARAIEDAPEVLSAIHREYADAGATVHRTATFRTQPRILPDRWEPLARRAVEIARASVPRAHTIAGSIAPLADCYRPDLSPADADPAGTLAAHSALATVLAESGCALLLCETFAHPREALLAVEAALEAASPTGAEVWLSLTPGFTGDLASDRTIAETALAAARLGAGAVLVNCAPVELTGRLVRRLAAAVSGRGMAVGAYANAGRDGDRWRDDDASVSRYADAAEEWAMSGATIVGSCCGTGPRFTKALTERLRMGS